VRPDQILDAQFLGVRQELEETRSAIVTTGTPSRFFERNAPLRAFAFSLIAVTCRRSIFS
jgi:hypothetical protein